MGKRDDKYTLEGAIELDDAFFSTEISVEEKEKPLKARPWKPKDQGPGDG